MVEVGVRELKARLSYYLQLAQAGELVAVKVRNRIVSFLSNVRPAKRTPSRRPKQSDVHKILERWKADGLLVSGGPCHLHPFTPVRMTPGPTTTEMLRHMRDED